MSELQHAAVQNRLLKALTADDFARLKGELEPISVNVGYSLSKPQKPVEFIYFPESGLASVTNSTSPGHLETGMIGRDGMVGLPVLLNASSCANDIFVQMPGTFLRIPVAAFTKAVESSRTMEKLLLRYVHVFLTQTAGTAMANATHTVEGKLARWLLMCHDRTDGDDLSITHEFLSMMLGVRRPGVTVATHVLEGNGLIRAKRGRITILDRTKLEDLAADAYGTPEAEYVRLFGGANGSASDADLDFAPAQTSRPFLDS